MAVLAAPVLGTYAVPGWIPACAGMDGAGHPLPALLHTTALSGVIFYHDFCPYLSNLPAGRASIGALLSGLRETD